MVVRTSDDAQRHVAAIRQLVATIDPNVPIYRVRTMQEQVDQSLAQYRLRRLLITIFSVAALLMAALGVYGVIACAVAERHREIAIRMALGAMHGAVRRMVVGQALALTAAGLILGLAGAVAATRLLSGFLYGVGAADPVTILSTSAVFVAVTLIATYVPARRATAIDPVAALRND